MVTLRIAWAPIAGLSGFCFGDVASFFFISAISCNVAGSLFLSAISVSFSFSALYSFIRPRAVNE